MPDQKLARTSLIGASLALSLLYNVIYGFSLCMEFSISFSLTALKTDRSPPLIFGMTKTLDFFMALQMGESDDLISSIL